MQAFTNGGNLLKNRLSVAGGWVSKTIYYLECCIGNLKNYNNLILGDNYQIPATSYIISYLAMKLQGENAEKCVESCKWLAKWELVRKCGEKSRMSNDWMLSCLFQRLLTNLENKSPHLYGG